MLAPNKQNLILLGQQRKLVKTGHKLLKEKRSGLIITFIELATQGKLLEQKLAKQMALIMRKYALATSVISIESLIDELVSMPAIDLEIIKKRISGVYVENLKVEIKPPVRSRLKKDIAEALDLFADFFPMVLELTQLRINCQKIAIQIQKTSRQISNLERKMEDIDAQTKFIKNALNEKNNLEKATLIKIFN